MPEVNIERDYGRAELRANLQNLQKSIKFQTQIKHNNLLKENICPKLGVEAVFKSSRVFIFRERDLKLSQLAEESHFCTNTTLPNNLACSVNCLFKNACLAVVCCKIRTRVVVKIAINFVFV